MESRHSSLKPALDAGLKSFIVAPLVMNDEPVGALSIASVSPDVYSEKHVALVE